MKSSSTILVASGRNQNTKSHKKPLHPIRDRDWPNDSSFKPYCECLLPNSKGEIGQLRWTDIDFERRLITINNPEKGSNSRVIKASEKCINMILSLQKDKETLFSNVESISSHFHTQRARIAKHLSNPRILKITLHTFRHWQATTEYHRTHDLSTSKTFWDIRNLKIHWFT